MTNDTMTALSSTDLDHVHGGFDLASTGRVLGRATEWGLKGALAGVGPGATLGGLTGFSVLGPAGALPGVGFGAAAGAAGGAFVGFTGGAWSAIGDESRRNRTQGAQR